MTCEQLSLDFGEPERRDPLTCPHVLRETDFKPARTVCGLNGGEVYTNCREVSRCVFEPPDNSPDAMARRRAEMGGGA